MLHLNPSFYVPILIGMGLFPLLYYMWPSLPARYRFIIVWFGTILAIALFAQMTRSNLIVRDVNGGYRALVDEYIPMKASQKYTKKPVVKAKAKPTKVEKVETKSEGIAALQPEATAKRVTNILVFGKPPEEVIKNMTVFQAKELYEYLKKIFGG